MSTRKTNRAYEKKCRNYQDECIHMMIDAHASAIQSQGFNHQWEEDSISAHLIENQLRKLPGKADWSINFGPKIISKGIADGSISAKKAKEPDIKFERRYSLRSSLRFEFHIEAKNLSERNWDKQDGAKIKANNYQRRYISTGIDNFCKECYPNGCLAAYVVQGNIAVIAQSLNARLQKNNRHSEQLSHFNGQGPSQQFHSSHTTSSHKQIELIHLFLKIP